MSIIDRTSRVGGQIPDTGAMTPSNSAEVSRARPRRVTNASVGGGNRASHSDELTAKVSPSNPHSSKVRAHTTQSSYDADGGTSVTTLTFIVTP